MLTGKLFVLKGVDLDDFDSCIFTEVLLPRRSSTTTREPEDSLQFEVHYRDTTKKTLLTFLFNHSRIMLIMDYLLDTYNFIMCRMFKPSAGLLIVFIFYYLYDVAHFVAFVKENSVYTAYSRVRRCRIFYFLGA